MFGRFCRHRRSILVGLVCTHILVEEARSHIPPMNSSVATRAHIRRESFLPLYRDSRLKTQMRHQLMHSLLKNEIATKGAATKPKPLSKPRSTLAVPTVPECVFYRHPDQQLPIGERRSCLQRR